MYQTKLEEEREKLLDHITKHQKCVKNFFEKRERPRKFMENDLVLLWDRRCGPEGMHHKFDSLWKGPFRIVQVNQNNSFILAYPTGDVFPFFYNDQELKLYQSNN